MTPGLFDGLFGDPDIGPLLADEASIAAMIRFERALARVEARMGVIPDDAGAAIDVALAGLDITPAALQAGTTAAGVPVPAMVAALRQAAGPVHGQYVHWGATSQDVMDTALILQLREVLEHVEGRLRGLLATLADKANAHAGLVMAGRTRGQFAAPTTLGLRIAGWAGPLIRAFERLHQLRPRLLRLQFGGAVGTLSILGERGVPVMEALAAELGLEVPPKPWHTERDALAELGCWLAALTAALARIGSDLILLGRSEIGEVSAGPGGGSSTMPQKANPVLAEALVTLGRRAPAEASVMLGAIVHVEERDAGAWASEWEALPRLAIGAGAGLRHAATLVESLEPSPQRMREAFERSGGALDAEALAFDLARQVPLPDAQAILKAAARAAAASGGTLLDELEKECRDRGLTVPQPDHDAVATNAKMLIERTFAPYRDG